MTQATVAQMVEEQLAAAGLAVVVEQTGHALVLSGAVPSAEARQAALDIAARAAPGRPIDNDLEVTTSLPVDVAGFQSAEPSAEMAEDLGPDAELDPDFADLELHTEATEAQEAGDVAFAPVDPVIAIGPHGEARVLGGFSPDSMDSIEVEPSAGDILPGDEALADAIRRELREDAATTDLPVRVIVRRGVAHLRGRVAGPEDADNAESVAARVPGIAEVVDDLEVAGV